MIKGAPGNCQPPSWDPGGENIWTFSKSHRIGCVAACQAGFAGTPVTGGLLHFPVLPVATPLWAGPDVPGPAKRPVSGLSVARRARVASRSWVTVPGPLIASAKWRRVRGDLGSPRPLCGAPRRSGNCYPVALTWRTRPSSCHGDADRIPGHWRSCRPGAAGAADRLVHAGMDGESLAGEGKNPQHLLLCCG